MMTFLNYCIFQREALLRDEVECNATHLLSSLRLSSFA